MRVIDLTHTIREGMPVYPGTEPPVLAAANSYEKDGFKETMLSMFRPPTCLPGVPRWTPSRRSSS